MTRFSSGITVRTLPLLPRSLPASTITVSPERMRAATLEHLRGERHDLHELAITQLACDRPEDARPARVRTLRQDHCSVVVEADVGAVGSAILLRRSNDHRPDDFTLLDSAARRRLLHRAHDDVADVADRGVLVDDADAHYLAGAGVV